MNYRLVSIACVTVACSASTGPTSNPGSGGFGNTGLGGTGLETGSARSIGATGNVSTNTGGTPVLTVMDPSMSGGRGSGGVVGSGGAPAVTPPPPPMIMPVHIDECSTNAAGLDAAATQKLMAGSGSAGMLRWLNPYDGTVIPRGLIAPLLMWDGATADAVYLHIQSSLFEYKGCLKPTGPNQLQLADAIWKQASDLTRGASDPFTLELTVSSGGTVTGPVAEKFVIAQATLKGSIFYNTYSTKLLNTLGANGA